MSQKRMLAENTDIMHIMEKNRDVIDALKKLSQLLDEDSVTNTIKAEKLKSENTEETNCKVEDRFNISQEYDNNN